MIVFIDHIGCKIRDDVVEFAQNPTADDKWLEASNSKAYLNPSNGTNIKQ
jgi:hypothetical protein